MSALRSCHFTIVRLHSIHANIQCVHAIFNSKKFKNHKFITKLKKNHYLSDLFIKFLLYIGRYFEKLFVNTFGKLADIKKGRKTERSTSKAPAEAAHTHIVHIYTHIFTYNV